MDRTELKAIIENLLLASDKPVSADALAQTLLNGGDKDALRGALVRDPVDAANDAQLLARLLDARCAGVLAPGKDPHGCP